MCSKQITETTNATISPSNQIGKHFFFFGYFLFARWRFFFSLFLGIFANINNSKTTLKCHISHSVNGPLQQQQPLLLLRKKKRKTAIKVMSKVSKKCHVMVLMLLILLLHLLLFDEADFDVLQYAFWRN